MRNGKIAEIQILRALAVSLVLLFHFTSTFPLGYLGVDMFFVISGYVIALSVMHDFLHERFSFWIFLKKRVRRLWPAFALFFVVTAILTVLLISPNEGNQQSAIKLQLAAIFSLTNIVAPRIEGNYFGATPSSNPYLHTWSLSAEEQIFFFFGLFSLIAFKFYRVAGPIIVRRLFLSVLIVTICISLITTFIQNNLFFTNLIFPDTYMSPIYRSYQFASGSALAVVHFFGIKRISNPNLFASLCFLLFLLNFGLIPNYINFRSGGLLVTLITLVLLHTRFSNTALWNPKTGLTKFLVWKGDVSYEIYLWHWPILVFSELIFSFGNKLFFFLYAYVITLVLSAASRSLVPRWIGNSDGWNLPRFWATISSGFVLISVAIGYFAQFGWERDWALGKHEIIRRDCDAGKISSDCSWYTNEHEEFAYVIGDSMSWAIGDAIIELNHHLGIATIARTRNSCSMGLPSNYNSFECNLWRGRVATEILSQRPKYVAIANADGYTELEKRATKRLINDFIEKKIPVLNISTPPGGDSYSARRSLLLKGPPNRFALRQATQDFEFKQRSSLIQHFDPSEYLCKPLCAIAEKGTEYYNYGAHLSVSGAFYLSPFLKLHIVELLKT